MELILLTVLLALALSFAALAYYSQRQVPSVVGGFLLVLLGLNLLLSWSSGAGVSWPSGSFENQTANYSYSVVNASTFNASGVLSGVNSAQVVNSSVISTVKTSTYSRWADDFLMAFALILVVGGLGVVYAGLSND